MTVWDFILPALPTVCGISGTVIEDRCGVEHGTDEWYEALDQHFKWLLQYKISSYFCKFQRCSWKNRASLGVLFWRRGNCHYVTSIGRRCIFPRSISLG
ncbi:hypothetical protein EV2_042977 [Malus domestica]